MVKGLAAEEKVKRDKGSSRRSSGAFIFFTCMTEAEPHI
jgi:hypothetical protein